MNYHEFDSFLRVIDKENPFSSLYRINEDTYFYIEPAFYTQLKGFEERVSKENYQLIIKSLIDTVKRLKKVIFTASYEFPQTRKNDFYILEINDITDPLKIYVEDKSRGSDYGD